MKTLLYEAKNFELVDKLSKDCFVHHVWADSHSGMYERGSMMEHLILSNLFSSE